MHIKRTFFPLDNMMLLFYVLIFHLTLSHQAPNSPYISNDCAYLILPPHCQCSHSNGQSQLHCHNSRLESLPKLPNNIHWYALDFSANNITTLEGYVFSYIYVEKLNLQSNYLQTIEITAFDQIENLKQLFLDHNQLNEFHPHILTSPGLSLEILDLSYNPFERINLGEILLQLPFLQEFYAISSQLTNTNLYSLRKLSKNQHHHHLKILDLSFNNLTTLCNDFFDGFLNLMELRLNNNNIYSIGNYFIRSLNYLQTLDLSFNSIDNVPNLVSSSLATLNLSSNNIQSLNDYFLSNLYSIRIVDLDFNRNLNSISSRSFCFSNVLTLQKLSFRFNNIASLEPFSELLCRLSENNHNGSLLDFNSNVNLRCDCLLIQFEKYYVNYRDLTCTQQGHDRYYIPQVVGLFTNCSSDFCMKQRMENLCEWNHAEPVVSETVCSTSLIEVENSTRDESEFLHTDIDTGFSTNMPENSTILYEQRQTSIAILITRINYIEICILLFFAYI